MKVYGIIGKSLQHSFSPRYFNNKFSGGNTDAIYQAFELETIDAFPGLLQQKQLAGINVTIPYKEQIIPFLDELDPSAENIGAVNCIQTHRGRLVGYNTDITGFTRSLRPLLKTYHQRALVLGTGGASKAIQEGLKQLDIPFTIVSRSGEPGTIVYVQIDEPVIKAHTLIINTTPLGTFPDINAKPDMPYCYINKNHLLYDLVYNPETTAFLQEGVQRGARVKNGFEMLCIQAEAGWEIWNQ
ncbi:MAG: shikimate dehydrogenase [Sphingobacteriales bacterium]|nr:MAG: shikimate dehydrogenase [Sphingobacteriales bacterium]